MEDLYIYIIITYIDNNYNKLLLLKNHIEIIKRYYIIAIK